MRLLSSIDGGPSARLGNGAKRMVTTNGLTYPVWDFNGIDISAALQGRSIDFWLDVDGVVTHATRTTYTNPTPTPVPMVDATPTPTETPEPAPTPTPVGASASCPV